jgi:arsenate reductase
MKEDVLFVCVHNSSRSQMAEAFVNKICPNDFVAYSAGLEPGVLNPLAVAVMREVGIDISANTTKSAFDLFKAGKLFSYVITVCDETSAERCPDISGPCSTLAREFRGSGCPSGVVGGAPRDGTGHSRSDSRADRSLV